LKNLDKFKIYLHKRRIYKIFSSKLYYELKPTWDLKIVINISVTSEQICPLSYPIVTSP